MITLKLNLSATKGDMLIEGSDLFSKDAMTFNASKVSVFDSEISRDSHL
jgi:hypothetical protein